MVKLFKSVVFKLYVVFLMAFTVWYGHFMYPLVFGFEGKEEAETSLKELGHAGTEEELLFVKFIAGKEDKQKIDLGFKLIDQPYIEGRFHHIGFEVEQDQASICVKCHGNVPHSKSKEVRSFLNMHAFYTACETCHIRPEDKLAEVDFRWYSKHDGSIVGNPKVLKEIERKYAHPEENFYPTYGNYGAKIAPGIVSDGQFSLLKNVKDRSFVERYIAEEDQLSQQQRSQMKKIIHKNINKNPIECNNCHQEDSPYIPFAKLGYPPRRVDELINTSVVGMIDKYKEFYIPNFLTPGDK